jgi:hypothetical protein
VCTLSSVLQISSISYLQIGLEDIMFIHIEFSYIFQSTEGCGNVCVSQ